MAKRGKFSLEDRDKGYKKFVESARHVAEENPFVKAGILERAGGHGGSDLSVAEIATIHEFGTEFIPERSVFRVMQATKKAEIIQFIKKLQLLPILKPRQALNLLGLKLVDLLKQGYTTYSFEPLSKETIERKGSSKPLIDTSQMRNSVQHEVVGGDE